MPSCGIRQTIVYWWSFQPCVLKAPSIVATCPGTFRPTKTIGRSERVCLGACLRRPKSLDIEDGRFSNTGALRKPLVDAREAGKGARDGQNEGRIVPIFGDDSVAIRNAIRALVAHPAANGVKEWLLRVQTVPHCENSNVCSHYAEPGEGHGDWCSRVLKRLESSSLQHS